MSKITSYLKKPSTYVLLFIGGIIVLAVPMVRAFVKPAADLIPGSKSKSA